MDEAGNRIERIETAALADLHAAAGETLARDLGLRLEKVGTAWVSIAGALPASAIVINRAVGLGVDAAESRETVERIVELYREAGVERYFVHLHPNARPADLRSWLEASGLVKARAWEKSVRERQSPPDVRTDLRVRKARPEDAKAFGRIIADAFDLGGSAAPWIGKLIGRPGWHVYMSFDGDTPAGTGTMFVRDGIAWLDWGATAPPFRRRGGQAAVLRRRILDALDLECRSMVTATGEEVEGDPQHSYNNIIRMGFRPHTLRDNYEPPRR